MGTLWLESQAVVPCTDPHFLALYSRSKDAVFQSYEFWDHLKGFTLKYHFLIFPLCPITGKATFCPISGMVEVADTYTKGGDTKAATILCFLTLAAGDLMTGSASKHLKTFISVGFKGIKYKNIWELAESDSL